jgi:DtxR family Mn-dependent transcriptional regulator
MLEVSTEHAHAVLGRLSELGLARVSPGGPTLTDEGRTYGIRILRTHRLLERYFADRTGAAPRDWHELAESAEHRLSADDAEQLAARMGHPVYDPHGDPIPTAAGDFPPSESVHLGSLQPGEAAVITHVEDEPPSVYARLLKRGVHVAMPVKVTGVGPSGIDVLVGGVPHTLDPLLADAVSVRRTGETDRHTTASVGLDTLQPGERAEVVQIAPSVQGPQRRRLLDLGVLPGTVVTAELRSPSGDPVAFRIRGALIALRQPQAQGVHIRPLGRQEPPLEVRQ